MRAGDLAQIGYKSVSASAIYSKFIFSQVPSNKIHRFVQAKNSPPNRTQDILGNNQIKITLYDLGRKKIHTQQIHLAPI